MVTLWNLDRTVLLFPVRELEPRWLVGEQAQRIRLPDEAHVVIGRHMPSEHFDRDKSVVPVCDG